MEFCGIVPGVIEPVYECVLSSGETVRLGKLEITQVWGGGSFGHEFQIGRADEWIWISDCILDDIEQAKTDGNGCCASYGDHILTLSGLNRTVSYGLVEHDPFLNRWIARKSAEVNLDTDQ